MKKGMILISMIIFIVFISLLLILETNIAEMTFKVSQNIFIKTQTSQIAIYGVQKTYEKLLVYQANCEISFLSSQELFSKTDEWWNQTKTCHAQLKEGSYQSVIEPLLLDECAKLKTGNAVQYYRITTRAIYHHDAYASVLLQAVVALPVTITQRCPGKKRNLIDVYQSYNFLR